MHCFTFERQSLAMSAVAPQLAQDRGTASAPASCIHSHIAAAAVTHGRTVISSRPTIKISGAPEFSRAPGSTDEHQHIVISPDQAARPVVELALDVARDLLRVQRWPELMRAVATQRNPQMST